MEKPCAIEGYDEAIRKEAQCRAIAFCGLNEIIAGIEVVMMTPYRMDWLVAMQNPFIIGGIPSKPCLIQFLWVLQKHFSPDVEAKNTFVQFYLENEPDYTQALCDVDEYLERTFMDAPQGSPSTPYYSATAAIVRAMAAEPYEWVYEKTIHAPVRMLYQLMRAEERAKGIALVNTYSDTKAAEFLKEVQRRLDAGEITVEQLEKMNHGG